MSSKYQMSLEDITNGIKREQLLERRIQELETELREAKEIKGLIFAILQMLKKQK